MTHNLTWRHAQNVHNGDRSGDVRSAAPPTLRYLTAATTRAELERLVDPDVVSAWSVRNVDGHSCGTRSRRWTVVRTALRTGVVVETVFDLNYATRAATSVVDRVIEIQRNWNGRPRGCLEHIQDVAGGVRAWSGNLHA